MSTHDGHVFYKRKGLAMMWVTRDLYVILYHLSSDNNVPSYQMHSESMNVKIYGGLVNTRVEDLNKFRTIISFLLRIIMNQCEPISLPNSIKKHMAISIDITKDPRKILFSKNNRCHELKFREEDRNLQTSLGIYGGIKNRIAQ